MKQRQRNDRQGTKKKHEGLKGSLRADIFVHLKPTEILPAVL